MRNTFNTQKTLNIKGKLLDVSQPIIMAILNVTPDSFYSKSRINSLSETLVQVEKFINQGASIIDIGAYSSRPGAADVSEVEEIERLIPVIEAIKLKYPEIPISVDTFRSKVAVKAVEAGAGIINDISGGTLDEEMFQTVSALKVPYILMHMRGTPKTMQKLTQYDDFLPAILTYFSEKIAQLRALGVKDIVIDPGFGFAKTTEQNFHLLNHLDTLNLFELPILVGFSRKSLIYKTLNITPDEALNGTSVLNTLALERGAHILRVHDVVPAKECIILADKIYGKS